MIKIKSSAELFAKGKPILRISCSVRPDLKQKILISGQTLVKANYYPNRFFPESLDKSGGSIFS